MIIKTQANKYIYVVECKTSTGNLTIQSEKQFEKPEDAKREALESLSEFTTEIKISGQINYNFH